MLVTVPMERVANYIDGELRAPCSGRYLDNIEPATGKVYSLTPDSDTADLEEAVAAAQRAYPHWSNLPLEERAEHLLRIAQAIEREAESLARAECIDAGKPISLARQLDIPRSAANFKFFAHALTQFASESYAMGELALNYTLRQPLGVVACISPWNLPLYLLSWKIAPALAAGNCVIAKPSELTPLTAHHLARICIEAGLPRGALNILHGAGSRVGAALVAHPAVKAISFTGGTQTGREIARVAAPDFKRLSLELGGKNPTLVFADCDWEPTIEASVRAAFANQGQICLSGSRIFVQEPVYARFKAEFLSRAEALTVGDPLEERTQQGALISEPHMHNVLRYIKLAEEERGSVLTGGERVPVSGRCEGGYFIAPTVIEGLPQACRTNREEIFGPVATLAPFADEEQALAYANDTEYGLAASIWSRDVQRCHRVAQELEAGVVWVNTWLLRDLRTPFGGMKHSGIGREGGMEALRFFTESKNVCIKL